MDGNEGKEGRSPHAHIYIALALLAAWYGPSGPRAAVSPDSAESLSLPPAPESLALKIARRYGLEAFPRVHSIHYVFHVLHGGKTTSRAWTWFPIGDSVQYRGKDPAGLEVTAAYSRKNGFSMASENVKSVDKSFVNDQYWLLFPFHLAWDPGVKLESGLAALEAGEAARLTATYPVQGGYTPGDAYDLFVDAAGTIRRWRFRRGNAEKTTMESRWSAPVDFGGLGISLERPGGDGFKVWFTDVTVE